MKILIRKNFPLYNSWRCLWNSIFIIVLFTYSMLICLHCLCKKHLLSVYIHATGGIVLHSGTNLIPNNDFITSVQDITSSTTITIRCTSHQQPHWRGPNGQTLPTIQNSTLHQILNGNTSILTVDTNNLNNFTNGRFSCDTTQHTTNVNLYIGPGGEGGDILYVGGPIRIV